MAIYELINPSDAITFETDNEKALLAGVLMTVQSGMLSLERIEDGETVLPIIAFMTEDDRDVCLQKTFGCSIGEYMDKHGIEIADALDSFLYAKSSERELFRLACKGKDDIQAFKNEWNEQKRTSMNNYGEAFAGRVKQFRTLRTVEVSDD